MSRFMNFTIETKPVKVDWEPLLGLASPLSAAILATDRTLHLIESKIMPNPLCNNVLIRLNTI